MRILVVDDCVDILELFHGALSEVGYAVDTTISGEEAEYLANTIPYDLILLDVTLPDKNGFDVCSNLRHHNIMTPVIMITGNLIDEISTIKGLDCGAIEFLNKPVTASILIARVKAVLRGANGICKPQITVGDFTIDTNNRRVWNRETEVVLTIKEYSILEYFILNPNKLISRSEIEQHVWDIEMDNISNVVDQHIKNLRRKLGKRDFIKTIRGIGYKLNKLP